MRTVKGLKTGCLTGVAIGLLLACIGTVQAQTSDPEKRFTTERPGSILIFPKVVGCPAAANFAAGTSTTEIEITNTSNVLTHAHCFYVNGATINGLPVWSVTDFEISLTRQQPTQWSACDGRTVNPVDQIPTSGLDPGAIPPLPVGFLGGLVCVQVHADGSTNGNANALKGEATIGDVDDTGALVSAAKYNAVAIQGINDNGDNELRLDNVEFAACPEGAHLNFQPENSEDEAINRLGDGPSAVSTTLAFMPCDMDFENVVPGRTVLSFDFRDEFETGPSLTPVNVECWSQFNLGDAIGVTPTTSSTYWYARIEATETGPGGGGFVGVANVRRVGANGAVATSATNLHFIGNSETGLCSESNVECSDDTACTSSVTDICIRNFGGRCQNTPATRCTTDAQCGGTVGSCVAPTIRLPLPF